MPKPAVLSAILAAAVLGLALVGCTPPAPTPTPSTSASIPADPALKTTYQADFSAATAEAETKRIADEIVSLLPASSVVHVDTKSQVTAATAESASYYGLLRIISLNPAIDPVKITKTLVQKIAASGWVIQGSKDDVSGLHLVDLTSNAKPNISWFLELSGDPRVEGQSVIQLQLASPDLR